jgi:triacylglycerol lipase
MFICWADASLIGPPVEIAMKRKLLPFLAALLAAPGVKARNPEPLRVSDRPMPPSEISKRVVLVHGFLETGSSFTLMRKRLEAKGCECLVVKLKPNDGRGGLEKLAFGLKRDVDAKYGRTQPISVIAFSMGGVVSREYLQNLGGAARCEKFFTISSPHHGTLAAWFYPSQGVEEMRPDSAFLQRLAATESKLGKMPVVSYRTPLDLIIVPASSSIWDRAENISHPALMHPFMVTSNTVLSDIERRLFLE